MASTRTVKLTVIADFNCVCCYVAYHELINAVSYCKDTLHLPLDFKMEHLPYRLVNPALLEEDGPKTRREFMVKHFPPEKWVSMGAAVKKWSEEKKVPISWDGPMGHTHRAHRLSRKAFLMGGEKLQAKLLMALYKANMEYNLDISDVEVLADIADEILPLTRFEVVKFINSDELSKEVEAMAADVRAKGITGVPMTIIDSKWAVGGGQSSDVYVQIFKKLALCGPVCSTPSHLPTNITTCPSLEANQSTVCI